MGRRGETRVGASEHLEIRRRPASGEAIGSIAAGVGRTKRTIALSRADRQAAGELISENATS